MCQNHSPWGHICQERAPFLTSQLLCPERSLFLICTPGYKGEPQPGGRVQGGGGGPWFPEPQHSLHKTSPLRRGHRAMQTCPLGENPCFRRAGLRLLSGRASREVWTWLLGPRFVPWEFGGCEVRAEIHPEADLAQGYGASPQCSCRKYRRPHGGWEVTRPLLSSLSLEPRFLFLLLSVLCPAFQPWILLALLLVDEVPSLAPSL